MSKLQLVNGKDEIEREIPLPDGGSFGVTYYGASGPLHDTDNLRYIRFEDKCVLSQSYKDTAKALINKYSQYFSNISADQLAFIVDEVWIPSEKASDNSAWKIDICKAPYWLKMGFGYNYEIKLRQHWLDKWSDAQLHAAIMSQLLRINSKDGSVKKYSEDMSSKLIATFGSGYLEPGTVIPDLLNEDVSLREFRRADGQITIEEIRERAAAANVDSDLCGECDYWCETSNGMGNCAGGPETGAIADSHPACDEFCPRNPLSEISTEEDEPGEDGDDHGDAA